MIKYIGSKRRLVPVIAELAHRLPGARTALDLFTGTTRVAQALKSLGLSVTAVDVARYAEVLARCYIALDSTTVDRARLRAELDRLRALPGVDGYVSETFCRQARFFQVHNGRRIDAIRDALEEQRDDPLFPVLLTSLIEAADRVDSTTGVQMAFVKQWAPRSFHDLQLREPALLPGVGMARRGDAVELAGELPRVDFAYLDPPYNQHRYYTNYHVWETLVAWDAPEHYGVACKRIDCRDEATKSPFNSRRMMPDALATVVDRLDARLVVLSYNDESWLSLEQLTDLCRVRGDVRVLAFDSKRYVGAQIGVFNPSGERVGQVSRLRNTEYLLIAGEPSDVATVSEPFLADAPGGQR